MNHVRDPGPEAVEKILGTLEDLSLPPTDVARQSRRLRAHIDALRDQIAALENLNDQLNSKLQGTLGGGDDGERDSGGAARHAGARGAPVAGAGPRERAAQGPAARERNPD